MSIVTRKLIAKELFVNRWLIVSGTVAGVASVVIAATGKTGFNIGALTWITSIIAVSTPAASIARAPVRSVSAVWIAICSCG